MNINTNYSSVAFTCRNKKPKSLQDGLNKALKIMNVKGQGYVFSGATEEGFGRKYVDKKGREVLICIDDNMLKLERTQQTKNRTIFEGLLKYNNNRNKIYRYEESIALSDEKDYTEERKALKWLDKLKLSLFGF